LAKKWRANDGATGAHPHGRPRGLNNRGGGVGNSTEEEGGRWVSRGHTARYQKTEKENTHVNTPMKKYKTFVSNDSRMSR
jgi:hypothetical protein